MKILRTVTSTTILQWLDTVFATHGYPKQIKSDNATFNQVLLKHVLTSNTTGKDWRKTLPTMIRNYRTTPHQSTNETTAKMLMQRELRTKLPSMAQPDQPQDVTKARESDAKAKKHAKEYADSKQKAKQKYLGSWGPSITTAAS